MILAAFVALAPPATAAQWTHFVNHADIRTLHEEGDTLWVGTGGGVLLVSVLTGDILATIDATGGLQSNSVRDLVGHGEMVYVGTDGGLAACRRARDGAISCGAAGPYTDIRHASFGPSGTLHVGTFGHGAAASQGGRVTWVTTADSLLDNKVYAVQEAQEGAVLYATSMGLCARTSTAWVSYQAGAGLPRGEVLDIVGTNGRSGSTVPPREFYVLVEGRGIYLFDGRRARAVSPRGLFADDNVAAIDVAGDGTLWAAGRYGKLARYRAGAWEEVGATEERIANSRWRCVHVGKRGVVYFGSADGFVAAVDRRGIRSVSIPSGVPAGTIGPMALDAAGRLWVADGAYLLSYNEVSGFAVEKDFGSVLAIGTSSDGAVWVVGRWGIYRKQADRWVEIAPDIDPRAPLFRSLAFDSSGHLWAGAETGEIYRFDGELWVRCAERGEFAQGPVERVLVDRRGSVWALAASKVYRFDGSAWAAVEIAGRDSAGVVELTTDPRGEPVLLTRRQLWRFSAATGWQEIPMEGVGAAGEYRAVGFDRDGRPYLATDKGIGLVNDGGFQWIETRGGMRGREATSVLADADGCLWIGFRRDGVSRISLEKP